MFSEQHWYATANRIQERAPEAAGLLHEHAPVLSRVHKLTHRRNPPGERLYSHGDLHHPGNMMLCADGSIAVFDWDRPLDVVAA